jgi:hypothetical protein
VLRIHPFRFATRDAKKWGVELVDLVQETTPARIHLGRGRGLRIVHLVDVPTIRWHLDDRVDPLSQ